MKFGLYIVLLCGLVLVGGHFAAFSPGRALADEPEPFAANLLFTSSSPIVGLAVGFDGSPYVLNYAGELLRIAPDGTATLLTTVAAPCGFSSYALAALPDGNVVVSSCSAGANILIKVDSEGNQTTLGQLGPGILSLASDPQGNLYLGTWSSTGNLAVNYNPNAYLTGADYIAGQISRLDTEGTVTSLYEGGLPMALTVSAEGNLYASLWGTSGKFTPENEIQGICDPRHLFWITLAGQVTIQQISDGQAFPVTNQLGAIDSLVSSDNSLFTYGISLDQACGIYQIVDGVPHELLFTEMQSLLTGIAFSNGLLYYADRDGRLYQAALQDPSVAVGTAETDSDPQMATDADLTPTSTSAVAAGDLADVVPGDAIVLSETQHYDGIPVAVMSYGEEPAFTLSNLQVWHNAGSIEGTMDFTRSGQDDFVLVVVLSTEDVLVYTYIESEVDIAVHVPSMMGSVGANGYEMSGTDQGTLGFSFYPNIYGEDYDILEERGTAYVFTVPGEFDGPWRYGEIDPEHFLANSNVLVFPFDFTVAADPTGTPASTATAAAPTTIPADAVTYTVRPGDTLSSIAEMYGISDRQLIEANGLSLDAPVIYVGQILYIPGATP